MRLYCSDFSFASVELAVCCGELFLSLLDLLATQFDGWRLVGDALFPQLNEQGGPEADEHPRRRSLYAKTTKVHFIRHFNNKLEL